VAIAEDPEKWTGRSVPRFEDAALLTGRGRFIDDLGTRPGTLAAAILRSPHAHADIEAIDCDAARAADGVAAVLTGNDVKALTSSLVVGVKAPLECWPIAVGRVRYVGEPVAVVVAADRYRAEDALELIEVRYRPLPAVVDPVAATAPDAPVLHSAVGSNVVGERAFRYGDPEQEFAGATHRIRVDVRYPRNSCTPIETYGVIAEYDPGEGAYDVVANFQGPFSLHPVMARALKVAGNRLRLRTPPDSGGSFGVKQANSLTLAFRLKMDAEENSVVRLDRCAEQQAFRHRSAGTHRVGLFATEVGAVPAHAKVLTRSARS
jgi:2-furoyl-CoA dehydrogenase large subunit